MAIAYVSQSTLGGGSTLPINTGTTVVHNCAGSDLYLVAVFACTFPGGDGTGTCTFHGDSMTELGRLWGANDDSNLQSVILFGLANPDTGGAYDLIFTNGPTYAAGYFAFASFLYSGVHQTVSTGVFASNHGNGNPALNVASASGEMAVAAASFAGSVSAHGGTQTERLNDNNNGGINFAEIPDQATAAFSLTLGDVWVYGGISLKPAGGGGGGGDGLMWLA